MGWEIKSNMIGLEGTIFGNNPTGLTEANKLFVMDTSEKQLVYLEHPKPYIPVSQAKEEKKQVLLM